MRKRRQRGGDQAEVNMTPMLDIVFILLIFFIVTATFLQEEGFDMTPPPPNDEPQNTEPNPVILVQIDAENRVFVNQRSTSEDRVLAAVQRIRAEAPQSAVLIEPNDEALHGTVSTIWDDMRVNGIPVSIQRATAEDS
ncbi:biopolymer transporter ExbD [Hyphobacterium sp. HN65]|uniref:Biopolymer transporter ExbD n=1 Tax=Hyphobacterium lacteum TaxID=3116575 RepID=A0ABU7LTX3_9PROT|nr:biopolymer transporter ExbD [Hyphobacterium sp. HN65]MEE2527019.1 biopolymer transporter ExbD [Hyphobacterium sp. HN65]